MKTLYRKPETVRRITADVDSDQLIPDLEQLKSKAMDMGASDAAVIENKDIIFNPDILRRIEADQKYPSIHLPLNYPKDDLQEAIRLYQHGIFFRVDTDEKFPDYGGGPITDEKHRQIFLKIYEISTAIESAGFYMGYHLSLGLAAGNCRAVFCADEKRCWPMIKGKTCVYPNMGRPSIEALGIDAVAMAKKLKWNIDEKAPCPILAGLVMIV
jgi:predicted metal-binding protein